MKELLYLSIILGLLITVGVLSKYIFALHAELNSYEETLERTAFIVEQKKKENDKLDKAIIRYHHDYTLLKKLLNKQNREKINRLAKVDYDN